MALVMNFEHFRKLILKQKKKHENGWKISIKVPFCTDINIRILFHRPKNKGYSSSLWCWKIVRKILKYRYENLQFTVRNLVLYLNSELHEMKYTLYNFKNLIKYSFRKCLINRNYFILSPQRWLSCVVVQYSIMWIGSIVTLCKNVKTSSRVERFEKQKRSNKINIRETINIIIIDI
jgi:hypothetical protein